MTQFTGSCTCGAVTFQTGRPLMRAYCHCAICKAYHDRDFADFTVFATGRFRQTGGGPVTYKVFKQPPLLRRGTCDRCAAPILEKLFIPGLPRMMLIPTRWLSTPEVAPAPSLHMFYDLRRQDHADGLPKANGYLPSQLLFARHLLPALLGRPAAHP